MRTSLIAMMPTLLAVGIAPLTAHAQEVSALSLEEAVDLFVMNSVELEVARGALSARLGEARQDRAIPNPTAAFTNEDLGFYSEQYFNVTQRVDFLWQRGPRSRNAEARANSARSDFGADSARMLLEMKKVFIAAWEGTELVAAQAEVAAVLSDLVEDASARVAGGDLASYDLQRLRVAAAIARRGLTQAEIARDDAERRLGSLLSADRSVTRVRAVSPNGAVPDAARALSLLGEATVRRPEVEGARARTEALEATATLVGRSKLEGVGLTGGFKQQSDGQNGLFLGLQMSVPLFDRKGGAADAAQAEIDRSRSYLDLIRLSIEREVALAEARLVAVRRQRTSLDQSGIGGSDELLPVARLAYDEGEIGIVELVDAADAFLQARLLAAGIRAEEWRAFFELEHAIGGLPADSGAQR